jgi:hypothetical protein
MLNLQAAPLGALQHPTQPPPFRLQRVNASSLPHQLYCRPALQSARNWRPTSILRVPHATGSLQVYLTGYITNRPFKASATDDLRASSRSSTQRARFKSTSAVLVATGPLQCQQLPVCVRVIAAENIRGSTWVSQTFDIPQMHFMAIRISNRLRNKNKNLMIIPCGVSSQLTNPSKHLVHKYC